ncbi:hypothetical protein CR513_36473, partial [Mucuna pruriens]
NKKSKLILLVKIGVADKVILAETEGVLANQRRLSQLKASWIDEVVSARQSTLDAKVISSIQISPGIKTDSTPAISSTFVCLLFSFSIATTGVLNVSTQINSIPMLNEMDFKVWKEAVEIVLDCMDLDLVLRVKEPIPTMNNLQEKRFGALFLRVKVQVDFLKRLSNSLPKMKRRRRVTF